MIKNADKKNTCVAYQQILLIVSDFFFFFTHRLKCPKGDNGENTWYGQTNKQTNR